MHGKHRICRDTDHCHIFSSRLRFRRTWAILIQTMSDDQELFAALHLCVVLLFFSTVCFFVIWSSYFPVFQCVIYKLYVHFPRFNFHKLAVFFLSFCLFAVTKQKNAFVIKLLFLILVVLFCCFWSLILLRIVIKDRRPFKMC